MNKLLMKLIFSSLCLIYSSTSLHAMKRMAETSEDEALPKRQKTDPGELLPDTSQESAYILEELMCGFSKKLQKLACELGVNAPKERLAWLLTMYAVLIRSQEAALKAARDATGVFLLVEGSEKNIDLPKILWDVANKEVSDEAFRSDLVVAIKAADSIVNAIDRYIGWKIVKNPHLGVTMINIITAAKKKVQEELLGNVYINKPYGVAQQAVLEGVLENFEIIFNWTYKIVLQELSSKTWSLEDEKALIEFNRAHLAQVNPNPVQVGFLAPWLVHMQPLDIFPKPSCSVFTRLRDDLYLYPVVRLLMICREETDRSFCLWGDLIFMIFENMIHAKIAGGDKIQK